MKGSRVLRSFLDLLLPPACLSCRRALGDARRLLCSSCVLRLPRIADPRCPRCDAPVPPVPASTKHPTDGRCRECREWPSALASARQATSLQGVSRDLVHALKYEGWRLAAEPMASRMTDLLPVEAGWRSAWVVPVPTTAARIRRRGYNQAALLAEALARASGRPSLDALLRHGSEASQIALHPEERRANVRGVFSVRAGAGRALQGRRVLLVDDVLTTGATASEAAEVLHDAGATQVRLLTFARSIPDPFAVAFSQSVPNLLAFLRGGSVRGDPFKPEEPSDHDDESSHQRIRTDRTSGAPLHPAGGPRQPGGRGRERPD